MVVPSGRHHVAVSIDHLPPSPHRGLCCPHRPDSPTMASPRSAESSSSPSTPSPRSARDERANLPPSSSASSSSAADVNWAELSLPLSIPTPATTHVQTQQRDAGQPPPPPAPARAADVSLLDQQPLMQKLLSDKAQTQLQVRRPLCNPHCSPARVVVGRALTRLLHRLSSSAQLEQVQRDVSAQPTPPGMRASHCKALFPSVCVSRRACPALPSYLPAARWAQLGAGEVDDGCLALHAHQVLC